jgi:hypothetical protein
MNWWYVLFPEISHPGQSELIKVIAIPSIMIAGSWQLAANFV